MKILFGDTETFNEHPIKNGSYRYAETVELLLFSYAIDDGPAKVWDVSSKEPMPKDLAAALRDPEVILIFHNGGMFDRLVLAHTLPDFPLPVERWHDTMAQAYSHSLPGSLDLLSEVLGLREDKRKSKEGKDLVRLFCQPRPKLSKLRRATRHTHPVEWSRFVEYARMDIVSMREVYAKLPKWNYPFNRDELNLWRLDQRINDRGVPIDLPFVSAALIAADRAQKELAHKAQTLTNGEVNSATQRDAMLAHILETHGVTLPDMKMATLERRMEDPELPQIVKELIGVRLAASTTSVAKYKRLAGYVNTNGRLRGTLQYCGANRTGRWAGRGPQFHNLPRPTLKQKVIDMGIQAVIDGVEDLVFDNPMELLSSAVRGVIKSPEGKKLCVADLANIEGRCLAWLAGETWKLKAFEDFDTIIGHTPDGKPIRLGADLYVLAYAKAFGIPVEDVTADMRAIGKVMELALGYEGGVGAFVTFALAYGIDLEDLAQRAGPTIPDEVMGRAKRNYAWAQKQRRTTHGLTERAWLVCESLKLMWRDAHPKVVIFWNKVDAAIRRVIEKPNEKALVGALVIDRRGNWLRIRLPSGRYLCYPGISIDSKDRISYLGVNQYSRKWDRLNTYSGKAVENITQAVSRDILAYGMANADSKGYAVILSVHDELITETPDEDDYSSDELSEIMSTAPVWARGFPLAAAGYETYRYKKG